MSYIAPKLFGGISSSDNMVLQDDVNAYEKYFGVGLNALYVINETLEKYQLKPNIILDIPSGYGRVSRFLRSAHPSAEIFASDIMKEAVKFCANFNLKPLHTTGVFEDIYPQIGTKRFDLIWSGSLITHLPESTTRSFLEFLSNCLSANGLAMVSKHGQSIADTLSESSRHGLKSMEYVNRVKSDFLRTGYGYHDYPNMRNYGVSFISDGWVNDAAKDSNLELLEIKHRAWAGHDVIVLRKMETSGNKPT